MRTARDSTGHRGGFTLTELLVVIAILLILIALIIPGFRHARQKVQEASCASNLHQLAVATQLYLGHREGLYFEVGWTPAYFDRFWMEAIRPFHGGADKIRKCPAAPLNMCQNPLSMRTYWSGECGPRSWMNNGTRWHEGSYGANGWLYSTHGSRSTTQDPNWYAMSLQIKKASRVPLYADCTWVDGWPETWERLTPGLNGTGAHVVGGSNHTARFGLARHGEHINMAFTDGHVTTVHVTALHQYLWKPHWTPHLLAMP